MLRITETVQEILFQDSPHLEVLRCGTLNLRAYAKSIKTQVELKTKKEVKLGSMVMALSRLAKNLASIDDLKPQVQIESLSIKSGLTVVNYEKTVKVLNTLSAVKISRKTQDFFVISEGVSEIAIVATTRTINQIEKSITDKTKSKFSNAVAITLTFDSNYVEMPNVLYRFVSALAVKRVNLLEVVSTLTEVSFIIDSQYMDEAVNVFKTFLK